jgi:hypothetical protein
MGRIRELLPAKLIIVVLKSEELNIISEIKRKLQGIFGDIDFLSESLPFDAYTYYYNEEMGNNIKATILSFENLIHVSELPYIKRITNSIEMEFSVDGKRKVNLDPGYFYGAQFVLATTKPREFRAYLKLGIWSEPVYFYSNKKLHPFSTTYPNYKSEEYIRIFENLRNFYLDEVKKFRGDNFDKK